MKGDCVSCRWHLSMGGDDQGICFCDDRDTSSLQSLGDSGCECFEHAAGTPDCSHCHDSGRVCAYCGKRQKLCLCFLCLDDLVQLYNGTVVPKKDDDFVDCPKCSAATITKSDLRDAKRYLRGEVRQ